MQRILLKSKLMVIHFLKFLVISVIFFMLVSCSWEKATNYSTTHTIQETYDCMKTVKYRSYGNVNVCTERFMKLQNIGDKSVFWAWYDKGNQYMIIQLKNTNYHYCGITLSDWEWIESASDMDEYYIDKIKWRYDCRLGVVPRY